MAEASSLPNSYESLYQQAMESASDGDVDAAVATFRRIIVRLSTLSPATLEKRPDLANVGSLVTNQLASIFSGEKRFDEAIESLHSGLRFRPDQGDQVEISVAMVHAEEGRLDVARESLAALTAQTPDLWGAWLALAQVEAKLGNTEAAEAGLKRAEATAPEGNFRLSATVGRFRVAAYQGDVERAVAAWDAAVAQSPAIVGAQGEMYQFLLERGETTRLRRYVDADPVLARAGLYRGLLALRDGDYTEARLDWERVTAQNPTQQQAGYTEWAEAALRLGDTQKAAAVISARPPDLRTPRGALIAAIVMARLGRMARARGFLTAGVTMVAGRFPWNDGYSYADWDLFTTLVEKREAWSTVKQHFDTRGA